jgi:hypothetical protein
MKLSPQRTEGTLCRQGGFSLTVCVFRPRRCQQNAQWIWASPVIEKNVLGLYEIQVGLRCM